MKTLRGKLSAKITAIFLLCALVVVCVLSAIGTAYLSDVGAYSVSLERARSQALESAASNYLYEAGREYKSGNTQPLYLNTNFRYTILSPEGEELLATYEGEAALWEGSKQVYPRFVVESVVPPEQTAPAAPEAEEIPKTPLEYAAVETPRATPTPRPVSADYQYELRNGGIYITSYIGTDYEVRVPAEIDGYPVRTIGLNAFSSRYEVETVILPEGLTALDKNAFRYCPGLTRVELPSTLQTIGDHAFYLCEGLTEIVIPEGVTEIGLRAFQGCKQLRKVTLPKSLKTISNYTFFECHKSLTIYAPKGSAAQKFAGMKGYGFVATE